MGDWCEFMTGVCVVEPKPGPIDYEKVDAESEKLRGILADARKRLGMGEA